MCTCFGRWDEHKRHEEAPEKLGAVPAWCSTPIHAYAAFVWVSTFFFCRRDERKRHEEALDKLAAAGDERVKAAQEEARRERDTMRKAHEKQVRRVRHAIGKAHEKQMWQ